VVPEEEQEVPILLWVLSKYVKSTRTENVCHQAQEDIMQLSDIHLFTQLYVLHRVRDKKKKKTVAGKVLRPESTTVNKRNKFHFG
jgi:glucan phosphoethanolaminetransferase (alkaline phosphatase superfamily)